MKDKHFKWFSLAVAIAAAAFIFLTGCSKDLSRETVTAPPTTDTMIIHDTVIAQPPLLGDTVWFTGYNLGIGDSLVNNPLGLTVKDTTEDVPTLDWDTHMPYPAPVGGIVICEYLSQDLFDNRTSDETYMDRLRLYRDAMQGMGWEVWVIYPKARTFDGYSPSGFLQDEYAERIQALTDSLKTPQWIAVEGTTKAVTNKLLNR